MRGDDKSQMPLELRLVMVLTKEMSRKTIMDELGLKDNKNFRESYLNPAIAQGWVEMTNPNVTSSQQSYRLTRKGKLKRNKLNNA